ncbi:conserved hypothetical protein [Rubrivivax sp. A210]|nr:conserved hypothetical protein [Rubrivivax sp. A210]
MAAAAATALWATPALDARTETAAAEALQLRRQALARQQPQATPAAVQAGAALAFREAFAPPASRAARVAALLALAEGHGLTLRRAEFRHQAEPALGLARYRITLPAEGGYAALRDFIAASLAADPALALDALRLARAEGGGLRAELRFTLWTRLDTLAVPAAPAAVAATAGARP